MNKVRLGVVGTGRLGGFHASKAAADPEVDFIGVHDVVEESRNRVANQFGVGSFANLDDLLEKVDAVVVAVPSVLHAETGRRILNACKHMLIEKPVTTTGETARELAGLAHDKNLVMQVGHVEQYNPAWREAYAQLDEVRLGGVPVMIDAERTSGYTFRSTDVGATLDLMIHDLELVASLIPSPLERISAFGFSQFGGHEDAAYAVLEYENGSVARLKASRIEQTPSRKMTIRTSAQTINVDFAARSATMTRPKKDILMGKYAPDVVSFAEMAPRVATFMQEEYETTELVGEPYDALALEMRNFVGAILRGVPSTVPGERAALAVSIAEEIVRDLRARGRKTVVERPRLRIAG